MMMNGGMSAKKKAIEELLGHLDGLDGEDLGSALKPKDDGLEVTKIEAKGGGMDEPDGDEDVLGDSEGSGPKMSPEEIEELIQAIQSKLGS